LADDYSYAVVSNPDKKSLWILSRTPKMDEQIYQGILDKLKLKQFDLSILKMTPQF
jgi:apolipoprotein D and lipocalin family protein